MHLRAFLMILASLVLLVVPERAQAQTSDDKARRVAEEIRNDLLVIDGATDAWAIEHNQPEGTPVPVKELAAYFKRGSSVQKGAADGQIVDVLGNPVFVGPVGTPPSVSRRTFDQLAAVASVGFWKPFAVK